MSLHLLLLFVSAHTCVVLVMLPHEVLSVRLYLHTLVVCISTGSSQSRICSFLALGCWQISPGTISQSKHTLRHWWGLTISYCIKHCTEPDYWVGPILFLSSSPVVFESDKQYQWQLHVWWFIFQILLQYSLIGLKHWPLVNPWPNGCNMLAQHCCMQCVLSVWPSCCVRVSPSFSPISCNT